MNASSARDQLRKMTEHDPGAARILVVEDEEVLRSLLQYNLESEGYRVETCGGGDDAEIMVRKDRPDLLILDWMLPGLAGIEILRKLRIRDASYRPAVIMLTGRCTLHDRQRGVETGADDYVSKPFSVPKLLKRVRELLQRSGRPTAR